jgi:ribosomal protein S18 acetylase RimI-like enzyme
MTDRARRVWRAGAQSLVLVGLFAVAAGIVIPVLAYLVYRSDGSPWIPALLIVLTVLALVYAWRFGLHPRLIATDAGIEVVNPLRRTSIDWYDITHIAPGENGLVVATANGVTEAWCVQKSNRAARRGEVTRADRVAHELLDILDLVDPPLEDEQTGLRIRRARFDESRLLATLERGASELALAQIFPPEQYPYPQAEVQRRWRRRLRDGRTRVHVLERHDEPVGYVAFGDGTIHHLGVLADQQRRGYGSALLEFASLEVFAEGFPEATLWVLSGNEVARTFYRTHGWTETGLRQTAEFPPFPEECKMVRRNPTAPRRSR